ncbi:MAG TPA: tyrosine--tRNA ligase [Alphaproteobacteria bacterium]|nr:tyrosine--tRNA ligase [Alphaproteobacteria bacterium]USO05650.1 MAG: tyrosine--tRNA ligase [Rhodospirillales bacterium]HOO82707.1 tyrosine--tRNA ligase [Alphaproteobacteria bacterium]
MTKYKSEFLNILTERDFIHQCSDFNGLDAKLSKGVQSAYIGFDATADSLHVGSLVQIMMLYWFQQCGHKPITLMGGGTTRVGDPSGKDESRRMLTETDIEKNIGGIGLIFGNYLRYGSGRTDALMVNNADWLDQLNYIDFLRDYGPHFTINRMMGFESVKLRLEREQPLTFLEFNYMILQAYDFVELRQRFGTILQMGGSDQWGNIINGVELWRRTSPREKSKGFSVGNYSGPATDPVFALTTPLLTTASGAKMGKTADGAVWLNADKLPAYDFWQYWRNTEDADVGRFLKLFTTLPMDEIARLEAVQGAEINEVKKVLAFEVTKLCHGETAAREAADTAAKVFEQGSIGADLPCVQLDLSAGVTFIDAACAAGLTTSKGEARRIISQGGAKVNGQPVTDPAFTLTADMISEGDAIKISTSKKKHALVKAS